MSPSPGVPRPPELIARYAPWSDGNNPTHYGAKAAREINALP